MYMDKFQKSEAQTFGEVLLDGEFNLGLSFVVHFLLMHLF